VDVKEVVLFVGLVKLMIISVIGVELNSVQSVMAQPIDVIVLMCYRVSV